MDATFKTIESNYYYRCKKHNQFMLLGNKQSLYPQAHMHKLQHKQDEQ